MRTLNPSMQGKLSNDPIRNMKYLFVVTTSLASRIAIEAGIPLETTYAISDLYIQKMDLLENEEEIRQLCGELYATYVKHIRKIKQQNSFSKPIMQCLNYIVSHFNENITLEKLSAVVNLPPNYFAFCSQSHFTKVFKAYTGFTPKQYRMAFYDTTMGKLI